MFNIIKECNKFLRMADPNSFLSPYVGCGIATINYLNINHNKRYIEASDDDKKHIYNNLTGLSILKGLLYGYYAVPSVALMVFDLTFFPKNFSNHVIPGSKYEKFLSNFYDNDNH